MASMTCTIAPPQDSRGDLIGSGGGNVMCRLLPSSLDSIQFSDLLSPHCPSAVKPSPGHSMNKEVIQALCSGAARGCYDRQYDELRWVHHGPHLRVMRLQLHLPGRSRSPPPRRCSAGGWAAPLAHSPAMRQGAVRGNSTGGIQVQD